jgi:hypothetical protein
MKRQANAEAMGAFAVKVHATGLKSRFARWLAIPRTSDGDRYWRGKYDPIPGRMEARSLHWNTVSLRQLSLELVD